MWDDALVGPVPDRTRQESPAYLAPVTGIVELRAAEALAAEPADSPPPLRPAGFRSATVSGGSARARSVRTAW
ncbi:hypothetical protein GCM10010260_26950 [Streptomyces filipinensis]|uniref:Uncharacterized protein n=1 Tax=Streptomyces filipinensis TaxID=66887 RepID=A0A918M9Z6_9ACTN|nr:hypothetical protein GCM10010260_26950 [Streptomyces filipinensis]